MNYLRLSYNIHLTDHFCKRLKQRINRYNRVHKTNISPKEVKNDIRAHLQTNKEIMYPPKKVSMASVNRGHKFTVEYVAVDQMFTRKAITFYILDYKIKNRKEG